MKEYIRLVYKINRDSKTGELTANGFREILKGSTYQSVRKSYSDYEAFSNYIKQYFTSEKEYDDYIKSIGSVDIWNIEKEGGFIAQQQ